MTVWIWLLAAAMTVGLAVAVYQWWALTGQIRLLK